jgi:TatD DNase family protein
LADSVKAGVNQFLCVGTSDKDSKQATNFVQNYDNCYASVGLHPHDAKKGQKALDVIATESQKPKVVAIGECGLDYWYLNSSRDEQLLAFRFQLELGLRMRLPFVFHVRGSKDAPNDAFDDFFSVIDEYKNIRGVVHSFSGGQDLAKAILSRSLLVGVNGIATFSKNEAQLDALKNLDIKSMVLETDAPFLTPVPKRGKVNTPEYMGYTAKFIAELRGEAVESIIHSTTHNAKQLFGIK